MIPSPPSAPGCGEGVDGRSAAGAEDEDEDEDAAGRRGARVPGQRLGVLLAAGLAGGRPAAAALRRGEIFLLWGFPYLERREGGGCTGSGGGWHPGVGCCEVLLLAQDCPWDDRGVGLADKDLRRGAAGALRGGRALPPPPRPYTTRVRSDCRSRNYFPHPVSLMLPPVRGNSTIKGDSAGLAAFLNTVLNQCKRRRVRGGGWGGGVTELSPLLCVSPGCPRLSRL